MISCNKITFQEFDDARIAFANQHRGKRRQKVHIEYDLVGYIPVYELLKVEQA